MPEESDLQESSPCDAGLKYLLQREEVAKGGLWTGSGSGNAAEVDLIEGNELAHRS
jgi:hypothetical protein